MDGMVEENGTGAAANNADPLASSGSSSTGGAHVVAVTSIVQLTLPTQAPSAQVLVLISHLLVVYTNVLYILTNCG